MRQVGGKHDRLAVHAENDVAHLQAALRRRAALQHLGHQGAGRLVQAEGFGQILVHFLDHHAQPATTDLAFGLELVGNAHGDVDRNGEGQTHEAAGTGEDLRVDADHLAVQVEQRAAGVTRVDRHVGLDERYIVLVRQAAALGADDTGRHRVVEAEGRTDGQHPAAHLELVGLADLHDRQILALDLEQGDVGTRIGADELGFELAAVGQAHDDFIGIGHHMVIGQDVAFLGDDEAGTEGLRLALAATLGIARHRRHVALEEFAQHRRQSFQVWHHLGTTRATLRHFLPGADIDHRRGRLFDQGREVRQIGAGHEGLTEQQHGCQSGHAGFEVKHRHTAPVA
ncbi:hypothetical protein D3C85_758080 [compost metagenome]